MAVDIVERLRQTDRSKVLPKVMRDGKSVDQTVFRNPDGPEAAEQIIGLRRKADDLQRENLALLESARDAAQRLEAAQAQVAALRQLAAEVMRLLEEDGPGIVPYLIDSDENPGERLRRAISNTAPTAQAFRAQVLEEAAEVAETDPSGAATRQSTGDKIAAAIRQLAQEGR